MERIISVIDKPAFYTYEVGDDKISAWVNEYTAVVEDEEGEVFAGPVLSEELLGGYDVHTLISDIKEKRMYERIDLDTFENILEGTIDEGVDYDSFPRTVQYLAEGRQLIDASLARHLKRVARDIEKVLAIYEQEK
jgi:hypothetical protein